MTLLRKVCIEQLVRKSGRRDPAFVRLPLEAVNDVFSDCDRRPLGSRLLRCVHSSFLRIHLPIYTLCVVLFHLNSYVLYEYMKLYTMTGVY